MENKTTFVVLTLLGAGLIYLWVAGQELVEIRTEIEISATPEEVWQVLSDIDTWSEWSPIINHASGQVTQNSTLTIVMAGSESGKNGPTYQPVITELELSRYLRWSAVLLAGFFLTNDKVLELQPIPTGTRLVHKELFKGMLVPVFSGVFEKNVPLMLADMNQALKARVE